MRTVTVASVSWGLKWRLTWSLCTFNMQLLGWHKNLHESHQQHTSLAGTVKAGSPRWPECPPTFWLRLRHLLCRCGLLVQSHQRQDHLHIQAPIVHFAQDSLECWASSVILETFYYDLWTRCPERKRLITHKHCLWHEGSDNLTLTSLHQPFTHCTVFLRLPTGPLPLCWSSSVRTHIL